MGEWVGYIKNSTKNKRIKQSSNMCQTTGFPNAKTGMHTVWVTFSENFSTSQCLGDQTIL